MGTFILKIETLANPTIDQPISLFEMMNFYVFILWGFFGKKVIL
jgi:hypothetical protein